MFIIQLSVISETRRRGENLLAGLSVILYNPAACKVATVAQLAVQPIRNRQVISSNLIGGSVNLVVFPSYLGFELPASWSSIWVGELTGCKHTNP